MKTFWVNGLNKMGLESGTYVLASKANERIKALEDAIEEIAECDSFFGRIELKNKALEVKP